MFYELDSGLLDKAEGIEVKLGPYFSTVEKRLFTIKESACGLPKKYGE